MKIMVLSGVISEYGMSLAKAFKALGNEVEYCEYSHSALLGFQNYLRRRIPQKLGINTEERALGKFYKKGMEIITKFLPDAFMVVSGINRDFYSPVITSYMTRFGKRPLKAIWYMDSIDRFPQKPQVPSFFDKWYTFEPFEITNMKEECGIDAHHLPFAYDQEHYHPLDQNVISKENKGDVSFIGSVSYQERIGLLDQLGKMACDEGLKFKLISHSFIMPIHFRYLKDFPYLRKALQYGGRNHKRNNNIYNYYRVNLNIHGPQAIQSVNPRFFEILGSGGLQAVEPIKVQRELGFVPDEDFLSYSGLEELKEKIIFAIENPRKANEIAKSGHEKVKKHDFKARAKFILEHAFSKG